MQYQADMIQQFRKILSSFDLHDIFHEIVEIFSLLLFFPSLPPSL